MAEIVLAIGCSHAAELTIPVAEWHHAAGRDANGGSLLWYHGERLNYQELMDKRGGEQFAAQMDAEECARRIENARAAVHRLADTLAAAEPDVVIIFGSDQGETFLDDVRPAISVFGCERFENRPRSAEQKKRLPARVSDADAGFLPDSEVVQYPGHPELGLHLVAAATRANFDVTYCHRQHRPDPRLATTSSMPHAYGFVYKQLFRDLRVPSVPIDINTWYPPNQPDAARCFALGRVIGRALREDWDDNVRVALVASGGLSGPVVDEEFDRDIIEAMESGDRKYPLSYHEGYYQAGSSEIKSWLALNGALRKTRLKGKLVDYQALYRTPAGTGASAAFMLWQE